MVTEDMLADWHREQAKKCRKSTNWRLGPEGEESTLAKFHLDAAKLIDRFSEKQQQARLAETERDVKIRAAESLEHLAKAVITESKNLRHMLLENVVDDSKVPG